MTRRNLFAAVAAVGVLAVVGCGPNKLNEEKAFNLSHDQPAQAFDSPAQGAAQSVKVEVSSDKPVDVYVLLGTTAADAVNLGEKDLKAKAKESKLNTKGDTLSVAVPAGQAVTVWVGRNGTTQTASGKVKLSN